jgi:hypothetical protein
MLNCQEKSSLLPAAIMLAAVIIVPTACGGNRTLTPSMEQVAQTQRGGASAIEKVCQPDFTLALSPTSATITAGQSVKITVKLASICGLAGTINVGIHGISPPPQGGDGFTIHQPRYDIPLDANSTAVAYITLGATQSTLKTTWTITIQGEDITGGCCYGLTHSANFALTVQ